MISKTSSLTTKFAVFIFCLPFFVSAQLTDTTPGNVALPLPDGCASTAGYSTTTGVRCDGASQQRIDYQTQIQKIIEDQQKKIQTAPTINDIRKSAVEQYLSIKANPASPKPNETITVEVQSNSTDLSRSTITWTLNNRTVLSGVGEKSFSFKNGNSGQTTDLTISITTPEGDTVAKNQSWTPVGVNLLWEANTYTPPFYKGKPLMSPQADVRVIAIPDSSINTLTAGNYVYNWKKDGYVLADFSGYGKNTFNFIGPKPYALLNVGVEVSGFNGVAKSETSLNIPQTTPFVLFYENNPLMGILYNKALGSNVVITRKEFSVSAEPYFFSPERSENIYEGYEWSLNNRGIENSSHLITLRNNQNTSGVSKLALSVRGIAKTFQNASQAVMVNFKAE